MKSERSDWRTTPGEPAPSQAVEIPVMVVAVAVMASLYGWALVASTISHPGSIGLNLDAPGGDYVVFYSVIRLFLHGKIDLIYNGNALTTYLNSSFSWWLPKPIPFRPWVYPPSFLLVLLPFGALPFLPSYLAFQLTTGALLAGVLRWSCEGSRGRGVVLCSALACPAASFNIVGGQNAFLVAALLIAGLHLLRTRPVIGGALLAATSFKPQFCLLIPVALVAAREGRALISFSLSAAVMVAISAALLGTDLWWQWLDLIAHTSAGANVKWVEYGRMWGDSVYASLVTSGLPASAANIGQAVAITTAACATYRAYRLPLPVNHRVAVLLSATILAAPHSTLADAVLLALAAALWISEPIGTSELTCKWPLILCLWLVPLFNPPAISPAGRLTPIVVTAIIVMIIGGSKAPQAPAIYTAAIS